MIAAERMNPGVVRRGRRSTHVDAGLRIYGCELMLVLSLDLGGASFSLHSRNSVLSSMGR
jgi:hypothetical protein